MDYIVKGVLTFFLLIAVLWAVFVSIPASIISYIYGYIAVGLVLIISCITVICGWKLSGKVV